MMTCRPLLTASGPRVDRGYVCGTVRIGQSSASVWLDVQKYFAGFQIFSKKSR